MKMNFEQEMEKCESEIERHLLRALYPELCPDAQKEIQAQYMIDYYDMPVTLPDFAFPSARIAIYCDGYEFHSERNPFQKDRQQSRALQLQGWLRLAVRGEGNPERDGRGSSQRSRASDTAASAGTGESAATAMRHAKGI